MKFTELVEAINNSEDILKTKLDQKQLGELDDVLNEILSFHESYPNLNYLLEPHELEDVKSFVKSYERLFELTKEIDLTDLYNKYKYK